MKTIWFTATNHCYLFSHSFPISIFMKSLNEKHIQISLRMLCRSVCLCSVWMVKSLQLRRHQKEITIPFLTIFWAISSTWKTGWMICALNFPFLDYLFCHPRCKKINSLNWFRLISTIQGKFPRPSIKRLLKIANPQTNSGCRTTYQQCLN